MAAKRRDPRARTDSPTELAAALAPHVDGLAAAAARREAEALAMLQRPRRLDEAELMKLIFAHLDDDNPRVCEGIDFDRLIITGFDGGHSAGLPRAGKAVTGPPPVRSRNAPSSASAETLAAGTADAGSSVMSLASGRSWIDEVRAVDPALLDRPELDTEQRGLLERARGRVLATVNLRRLEREPALAHLELFVGACRQQRARFVRAITGKGIESRADPVIKRAVLHWCLDRGHGCAPELDVHGEWGALVIELGGGHA